VNAGTRTETDDVILASGAAHLGVAVQSNERERLWRQAARDSSLEMCRKLRARNLKSTTGSVPNL
jgi:hypothetical protein